MLFMGQEFAASTPFLFFTDFDPELGRLVTEGRRAEFAGFRAFADPDMRDSIPDPQAESTFLASKLDLAERKSNAPTYRLYQELLALRRGDPVLRTGDRAATRAFAVGARDRGRAALAGDRAARARRELRRRREPAARRYTGSRRHGRR